MKKIDKQSYNQLCKKREKYRLRRLRGNKTSKAKGQRSKYKIIEIPSKLNLNSDRDIFFDLIKNLHDSFFSRIKLIIDHRSMHNISKEALLVLTAEIERCTVIQNVQPKIKHKYTPSSLLANTLLTKIGYWNHFNIKRRKYNSLDDNILYLKIVSGTQVSGEKIGSLITFFENIICFDAPTRDMFSDAMLEASANTVEHAYSGAEGGKDIKKWWLTASLTKDTNEISFVFYDQGHGILNTLESKQKHIKLQRLVTGWLSSGMSKGKILKNLATTNLSSYKDERRGNGLISFKSFIDQVEDGELTIYTGDVSYSVVSDKIRNYTSSLDGTLIAWKIKANHLNDKCIYIKGIEPSGQG